MERPQNWLLDPALKPCHAWVDWYIGNTSSADFTLYITFDVEVLGQKNCRLSDLTSLHDISVAELFLVGQRHDAIGLSNGLFAPLTSDQLKLAPSAPTTAAPQLNGR